MRILFLHTSFEYMSPEYSVHINLVNYLERENLEPFFIWQSPGPVIQEINKAIRIFQYDFGRNRSLDPKPNRFQRAGMILPKFPNSLRFLIRKTREINPDIIYSSQQKQDVFYARILSTIFKIPHIIHVHYTIGPWLGLFTYRTILRSRRLIAVSEFVRQNALLNGIPPTNVHTVVNSLPVDPHQELDAHDNICDEFDWPRDAKIIVAVGRLDPMKGHSDLIKAFAKVISSVSEARLIVCGKSTYGNGYDKHLQNEVLTLNIQSHVVFAGHRNDIPRILQGSDVFCLPTQLEPFGLVFLEAMAAGIPIVAYHSGAVSEIVIHSQTGLLSYPGNILNLAENILSILGDPELAHHLGEVGKQRVLKNYNPNSIAEDWFTVLEQFRKRRD